MKRSALRSNHQFTDSKLNFKNGQSNLSNTSGVKCRATWSKIEAFGHSRCTGHINRTSVESKETLTLLLEIVAFHKAEFQFWRFRSQTNKLTETCEWPWKKNSNVTAKSNCSKLHFSLKAKLLLLENVNSLHKFAWIKYEHLFKLENTGNTDYVKEL